MLRALVAVDGSKNSLGAVRHVIQLAHQCEPLEIHLLNVQPPLHLNLTLFVSKSVIRGFHEDEAAKALAPARELLDRAGVPYATHVVVGHAGPAIAECAKRLHCDKVVMGTRGLDAAVRFVLGSVSNEAIRAMDPQIAITLVKANLSPA
jgi:nucleotide-binding universal stress UspA family protein